MNAGRSSASCWNGCGDEGFVLPRLGRRFVSTGAPLPRCGLSGQGRAVASLLGEVEIESEGGEKSMIELIDPTEEEWRLLWELWEGGVLRLDGDSPIIPDSNRSVCVWWIQEGCDDIARGT